MNTSNSSRSALWCMRLAIWALGASLSVWSLPGQTEEDDPASRVARISYLKGQVYVQTADDDAWTTAGINRPLTSGDQLWTDDRGRSELQMGSTAIQLDANTQLRLLELSDEVMQLQVTQGVVNVRVRSLSKRDTVEVDTPNAAVSVMEPGTYRIEVADQDELTVVQVRDGSVDVAGEKQSFTLRTDEQLSLRGSQRLSADFDQLTRMDEFDRWADERNRRGERVASARYVAADVIGYEDLDDYGYWRHYDDYGYVWMPSRVAATWAPYRYGHWSWVSPWGWTWIDDAPWGFAPFHYGRWTTINNRWCWVPGPRAARAVYAPALVAWIGTPGLSVSINIGTQPVGWIPLGPREVYRPIYRSSRDYVTRVNLNNSLLDNTAFERGYRREPHEINYGNRNAASVVQANTLREARPVNGHLLGLNAGQLQATNIAPVSRPERNASVDNERRLTPPVAANARDVLARRRPVTNRIDDNGVAPSTTNKFGGVRVVDPLVTRRSNNGVDNSDGRSFTTRPSDNTSINPTPDIARRQNRDPDGNRSEAPNSRSTRSIITAPYVRPEIKNEQRGELPASTPVARPSTSSTVATPTTTEPRVRSDRGMRDEARLGGRESKGAANNGSAQPIERERSMPVPSRPAPTPRSEPAPTAPAIAAPDNSQSNRSQNNREENVQRRRGLGGDAR